MFVVRGRSSAWIWGGARRFAGQESPAVPPVFREVLSGTGEFELDRLKFRPAKRMNPSMAREATPEQLAFFNSEIARTRAAWRELRPHVPRARGNIHAFAQWISAAFASNDVDGAMALRSRMDELGVKPDLVLARTFVHHISRVRPLPLGRLEHVLQSLYDNDLVPDVITLMRVCVTVCDTSGGHAPSEKERCDFLRHTLDRAVRLGPVPDPQLFESALSMARRNNALHLTRVLLSYASLVR